MKRNKNRILTVIDVGTTKICVLIARELDRGQFDILGMGNMPSHGLKRGVIVDVGQATAAIYGAIQKAESMAGVISKKVCVGISGSHIHAVNTSGTVPIKSGQVGSFDIQNVLASAQAIPIAESEKILHILPHYYTIDGGAKVIDPLGMHGINLEVRAHIILGSVSSVRNLITCCYQAGVVVTDVMLEQLASAEAVLTTDEQELGVGVLDIGGGTADFAVYQNGAIRHTKVFSLAGTHFTRDLAIGLCTTIAQAEEIKKESGCVYSQDILSDGGLVVDESGDISSKRIMQVLQPRGQELIQLVAHEIHEKNLRSYMTMGLVLTGGGALLQGMDSLARDMLNMPARIGYPAVTQDVSELLCSPVYATSYGLLTSLCKQRASLHKRNSALHTRIFERMKSWMSDLF